MMTDNTGSSTSLASLSVVFTIFLNVIVCPLYLYYPFSPAIESTCLMVEWSVI